MCVGLFTAEHSCRGSSTIGITLRRLPFLRHHCRESKPLRGWCTCGWVTTWPTQRATSTRRPACCSIKWHQRTHMWVRTSHVWGACVCVHWWFAGCRSTWVPTRLVGQVIKLCDNCNVRPYLLAQIPLGIPFKLNTTSFKVFLPQVHVAHVMHRIITTSTLSG